jgi:hypothetical protein
VRLKESFKRGFKLLHITFSPTQTGHTSSARRMPLIPWSCSHIEPCCIRLLHRHDKSHSWGMQRECPDTEMPPELPGGITACVLSSADRLHPHPHILLQLRLSAGYTQYQHPVQVLDESLSIICDQDTAVLPVKPAPPPQYRISLPAPTIP